MSHSHLTASSSNFQSIINNALKVYKKRTGKDLLTDPLVSQLQACDSSTDIIALLQQQVHGPDQSRSVNDRWTEWLDPTISVLFAFSAILGAHVGMESSTGNLIFVGIGVLLSAVKDVRAGQDTLVNTFDRIKIFLRRLENHTEVPPTTEMMDIIVQVMVEVLSIVGIARKEIKQSRIKTFLKKLIGRTDMEDALKRLDELTEEIRMAVAQNLGAMQAVEESVRRATNTVIGPDNSVADVDDGFAGVMASRVARVNDEVASVDDRAKGINATAAVDDRGTVVGDKVAEVIHDEKETKQLIKQVADNLDQVKQNTIPRVFPAPDMSGQSASSHLQVLFEAALHDYEKQTGVALAKHPLANKLQNCDTVESIIAILREQTQAFSEFRERDKVLKPLKSTVSVLCKLSSAANFGHSIGLHFPPVTAVHTGLAVLFSAVKGTIDSYDGLVDLLESIDHFLNRLDIYTKVPPTDAMNEVLVKILVELLSTLALATKQIKEGTPKNILKKLLGEKDVEAILKRLDRLTQDEARITAAQTLEVVHGLFQNIRRVMDDGEASVDNIKETLKIVQQLTGDLNKSKRDSLHKDIFTWLSPPDPWKNHNLACKSRHGESASWFIQGNTFSEWKASEATSSLLWVHGKPGAGKSVFCSTIIEDIDSMRKAGLASLAFFYFDFREDQKKALRGLLSSLLVQLCRQTDSYCDMLIKFYSEHDKGLRHPSDDALVKCLKDLIKLPGQAPVYLILDALDECPNESANPTPRAEVLNLLEDLINSQFPNLRICVTSRPETDIKDVLDPLVFHSVSLHDQSEQRRDIEEYIKSAINTHPKNKKWKAEHKQLVIDVLTKKADGMFRWVYCQVVYICGCIPARIQHALVDLPETLDETYQRTLREINKADWEFAHRLLQFVAVASRPLRVEELAELLAYDFKAGQIPKFREGWRLEDPVDAVLSTCSSLLAIVDDEDSYYGKVIQFSHFSVKEFLISTRLAEATDIIPRRYHISMTPAHTLVAQACLGILLHLDKDVITRDSLKKWPLAEYAAEHWASHALFEGVSQNVEDGVKQMFDPRKPHLAVSVWIYNPWTRNERTKRPLAPLGTHLHYAAIWGVHFIIEFLINERPQEVRSQDFPRDATPLHLASQNGHVEVARILVEHGADMAAQKMDGETPLHLALNNRQVEVARMLIERGADVAAQNKDETPLHLASQYGQVEVARMLVERGADLEAQNKYGETPLNLASQNGEVEIARMLIERGADVATQDKDGETPLHPASRNGEVEVARMLIERGADVAAQNEDGDTPLHLASQFGQVEVARMLVERGADIAAQNKDGGTPLHLVSQNGEVEAARMLIEHGADVAAQNEDGKTPLHLVSQNGQVEVARMLVERGADVAAQDEDGDTPLHLASPYEGVEVARMLVERGADLAAKNKDGKTPLHLASQNGQVEVARMLVECGADVAAQDEDGDTPLHLASQNGEVEVARMLIERGADVAAQNEDGETPLHLASQFGEVEVTRMLIECDAGVSAQTKHGETPLHFASMPDSNEIELQGLAEVSRTLLGQGADVNAKNKDGLTPFFLASQSQYAGDPRLKVLLDHGAIDSGDGAGELGNTSTQMGVRSVPLSRYPALTTDTRASDSDRISSSL